MIFYGVGLYRVFDGYDTFQINCYHSPLLISRANDKTYSLFLFSLGESCQWRMFRIESKRSSNLNMSNLNTIGTTSRIDMDGVSLASYKDNSDVFPDNIAIVRLDWMSTLSIGIKATSPMLEIWPMSLISSTYMINWA